jgi:hypothetical protein
MKPEQLYHELKSLAEQLGLQVFENNFKTTGIHVRSGYCIVKDKPCCIIDKSLKIIRKAEALAECISQLPHETIYVVPAVREYLEQFTPIIKKQSHPIL